MPSKQMCGIIRKLCQNYDSIAYETEYSLQSVCLLSLLFFFDFFDIMNMVTFIAYFQIIVVFFPLFIRADVL